MKKNTIIARAQSVPIEPPPLQRAAQKAQTGWFEISAKVESASIFTIWTTEQGNTVIQTEHHDPQSNRLRVVTIVGDVITEEYDVEQSYPPGTPEHGYNGSSYPKKLPVALFPAGTKSFSLLNGMPDPSVGTISPLTVSDGKLSFTLTTKVPGAFLYKLHFEWKIDGN